MAESRGLVVQSCGLSYTIIVTEDSKVVVSTYGWNTTARTRQGNTRYTIPRALPTKRFPNLSYFSSYVCLRGPRMPATANTTNARLIPST